MELQRSEGFAFVEAQTLEHASLLQNQNDAS